MKVAQIYIDSLEALELHQAGVHLVSTDEKSGIQALERSAPTLPMQPGRVERREFEYIRHGTQCLIANLEVATGQLIAPSIGVTRTEADFLAHIQQTVATDPKGKWIFITDQLNIHQSESLVKWVASSCGIKTDVRNQRRVWHPRVNGDTSGVFTRPNPSNSVRLHTKAHFLVESD